MKYLQIFLLNMHKYFSLKEKNIFSEEVDTALQIALKKSPVNPIALTLKGVKYFQAGETDLALSSWEKLRKYQG